MNFKTRTQTSELPYQSYSSKKLGFHGWTSMDITLSMLCLATLASFLPILWMNEHEHVSKLTCRAYKQLHESHLQASLQSDGASTETNWLSETWIKHINKHGKYFCPEQGHNREHLYFNRIWAPTWHLISVLGKILQHILLHTVFFISCSCYCLAKFISR